MRAIEAVTSVQAWLQAADYLLTQGEWRSYTLVLEIASPIALPSPERAVYDCLDRFLVTRRGLPLNTVVNTIFPVQLYRRYGADGVYEHYPRLYPKLAKHPDARKWGTYALRLVRRTDHEGVTINPLKSLVDKLRGQLARPGPNRAIYELNLVDPFLDLPIYDVGHDKDRPIGGPCLSHVSFKLTADRKLILTAFYRSHYYIQRALGNLVGLAHLQHFVAREADLDLGPLVCHSSMAQLDTKPGGWGKKDIPALVESCHTALRSGVA